MGMGMGGNNNYNNWNGGTNMNKPPIPFGSTNVNRTCFFSILETIANGQAFAGNSKKILEKIKSEHTKAL
jgi:hypothetical protein